MSEPPILPNPHEPANENPFAPTYLDTFDSGVASVRLDTAYWLGFGALMIGSVWFSLTGFPLAWLGIIASLASAVRVPLLQRKHPRDVTGFASVPDLPPPLALLFTSLALMIVFVVVSFIAFVAICVPSTIAFGWGDNTVAMISGIIGILCFCLMFFLSLRLRF